MELNIILLIALTVITGLTFIIGVTYLCHKKFSVYCVEKNGERQPLLGDVESRVSPYGKYRNRSSSNTTSGIVDEQNQWAEKNKELEKKKQELEEKQQELEKKHANELEKQQQELEKIHANELEKKQKELEEKQQELEEKQKELEKIHADELEMKQQEIGKNHADKSEKQKSEYDSKQTELLKEKDTNLSELKAECQRLKKENDKVSALQETCNKLQEECDILKKKLLKRAKVCIAKGSGEYGTAIEDFLRLLKQKTGENLELTVTDWSPGTITEYGDIVLLFCLSALRIGTDIDAAFENAKIKGGKTTGLIIMHALRKEKTVTPTIGLLDQQTRMTHQLETVVDCTFQKDSGLHNISLNNESIEKIAKFIKTNAVASD